MMTATAEYKTADNYLQTLFALSREVRIYIVSRLTDSLLHEEAPARRKARVIKRTSSAQVTDVELEAQFAEKAMPPYPATEPTWAEVIDSNSGRIIKPIEKWL